MSQNLKKHDAYNMLLCYRCEYIEDGMCMAGGKDGEFCAKFYINKARNLCRVKSKKENEP